VQSSAEDFDKLRGQVVSYIRVIDTLSGARTLSSISELRHSISELKLEIVSTQAWYVFAASFLALGTYFTSVISLCFAGRKGLERSSEWTCHDKRLMDIVP